MSISDLVMLGLLSVIILSIDFILYRIIYKIDKTVKFWEILIPFYNLWIFVRTSGNKPWSFILLFIPVLNILYLMFIWHCILRKLDYDSFSALYWSTIIMLFFGFPTIFIAFKR